MKTLGNRLPPSGWEAADQMQKLATELSRGRPFIPKGVHKFHSFQEAQAWSLKMMTKPKKPNRRDRRP